MKQTPFLQLLKSERKAYMPQIFFHFRRDVRRVAASLHISEYRQNACMLIGLYTTGSGDRSFSFLATIDIEEALWGRIRLPAFEKQADVCRFHLEDREAAEKLIWFCWANVRSLSAICCLCELEGESGKHSVCPARKGFCAQ